MNQSSALFFTSFLYFASMEYSRNDLEKIFKFIINVIVEAARVRVILSARSAVQASSNGSFLGW